MLHENLGINEKGNLTIGGVDAVSLAEKYGTPLLVMDEDRIRANMRAYKTAMQSCFGGESMPLYASKAMCCKEIYRIAAEEGIGVDVVSAGELYTVQSVGFDLKKVFFHGNNKTDADIKYGVDAGVGVFVCDCKEELAALDAYCAAKGKVQNVILRLTPGIDAHTHKAVVTGNVDSKFGFAIATGDAEDALRYALNLKHINVQGFHCHIGSQIFETEPFIAAADIMLDFIAYVKSETGFEAKCLNLGGGLGVKYTEGQKVLDYGKCIAEIALQVKASALRLGLKMPTVYVEPGRSIVADAGLALYTVGSVKSIKGYKNYVSVDGGMPDNPRYALYQSPYTVLIANRVADKADYLCTVAGRCCESGDILQENVLLPLPQRGDVLAMPVAGAYHYSMASNYNRIPKPAVVSVKGGADKLIVKRETFEDMLKNEL